MRRQDLNAAFPHVANASHAAKEMALEASKEIWIADFVVQQR